MRPEEEAWPAPPLDEASARASWESQEKKKRSPRERDRFLTHSSNGVKTGTEKKKGVGGSLRAKTKGRWPRAHLAKHLPAAQQGEVHHLRGAGLVKLHGVKPAGGGRGPGAGRGGARGGDASPAPS